MRIAGARGTTAGAGGGTGFGSGGEILSLGVGGGAAGPLGGGFSVFWASCLFGRGGRRRLPDRAGAGATVATFVGGAGGGGGGSCAGGGGAVTPVKGFGPGS